MEKLITSTLEGNFSSTWRKPVRKVEKSEEQVQAFLQSQQAIVKQKFFEIKVDLEGNLVCAPFGIHDASDDSKVLLERPEIKFKEFSKKNTDKFGWWHLSCSYKVTNRGKVEIKANLFN